MDIRVNVDHVCKVMKAESLPYWIVLNGKQTIDKNQTDASIDNAVDSLRDLLEGLEGHSVTVRVSNRNNEEKSKGGRGAANYEYAVKLSYSRPEANGNISLMKQIFELEKSIAIDKIQRDYEAKLSEATKKTELSPGDRALEQLLPSLLPLLKQAVSGQITPGVHGIGINDKVSEEKLSNVTAKEAFVNIINTLKKADPKEYLDVLGALATIARDKPKEYATYKPLLISMAGGAG